MIRRSTKAAFTKGLLVSLDPGARQGGLAAFRDGTLIGAGPVVSPVLAGRSSESWHAMVVATKDAILDLTGGAWPDFFVSEQMVVRKAAVNRGRNVDPDDLLQVAYASAWTAGLLGCTAKFWKPEQLRGQTPKDVLWNRSLGVLTPAELKTIRKANADLTEDIRDAVGNGLIVLGRI